MQVNRKVKVLVTQSCPTLGSLMDHSPPGSSVHGVLQARIPSPGDLPNPWVETRSPALQVDSLPSESPGKPTQKGCFLEEAHKDPTSTYTPQTSTGCQPALSSPVSLASLPFSDHSEENVKLNVSIININARFLKNFWWTVKLLMFKWKLGLQKSV